METAVKNRIRSIDILRGLVMVIMALDHVRDFFHVSAMTSDPLDPRTTYPALFFTRWITHFCAPVFVFLSGVSARLAGTRRTPGELSRFLLLRGLWLIIAEVVIVTLGITFNPFYNVIILQVIWAIGTSMVLLGLLVRLPVIWTLLAGVILVFGHQIADYLPAPAGNSVVGQLLLTARASVIPLSDTRFIFALYAVLPWAGVMFLGYAAGSWYLPGMPARKRMRNLLIAGGTAVGLFIILRLLNGYGDPAPWEKQRSAIYTFLSFLNTTKYPPSLMFVLMILGPSLLLLGLLERLQGRLAGILSVYGKVPFFYYVIHFYLIHLFTVAAFFASGYPVSKIADPQIPFFFRPVTFGYDLWAVYLIWLLVVVLLYAPCRWFSRYKAGHKQWWLSYL
ncbi:MAG TPA: heparan-alpha-glucosaminide N-acetyltransferase domain-containing protein [Sphingobacteriaceae bacterium]